MMIDHSADATTADVDQGWAPHYGEHHPWSKLDADKVREIRRAHAAGEAGFEELARRFGVSGQTVRNVVRRKTWRHVT